MIGGMKVNEESLQGVFAVISRANPQQLSRIRLYLDEVTRNQTMMTASDPDDILIAAENDAFSSGGMPTDPIPVPGGVVIGTSIYKRGQDTHDCYQWTIRESRQGEERWVWESEWHIHQTRGAQSGRLTSSLHLVQPPVGGLLVMHPMQKRPVKGKAFSAHTRGEVSVYEVTDIDAGGTPVITPVYDVEPAKLPVPANH